MTSFINACRLCLLITLALSVYIEEITAQRRQCNTPNNRVGTCVNVEDCPLIAQILRDAPKPLPEQVQDFIKKSNCGVVNNKHGLCCQSPLLTVQPADSGPNGPMPASTGDISSHRNLRLLPSEDCGPISTNKVAGGELAGLGEFPWMVLLRYNTPEGLRYLCGGSLISRRYILTAAHCVTRLRSDTSLYSVILGDQNTKTDPDCAEGVCNSERREVFFDSIIPHASYNNPRYSNDIALVRLSEDISFGGEYIKPVCLPITTTLVNQSLRNLVVSGWGITENQTSSEDLLKAKLSVVPMGDCQAVHRRVQLDDNQICAKGTGIIDTCKGDSGGPLVFPYQLSNTGRFIQFGIVSAGAPGCGEGESKPGIYVRVQKYMNWILDNMQD